MSLTCAHASYGKVNISSSPIQLENALLQAKRLGRLLDLPLTSAKKILARGPYRCDGWKDLESRLTNGTADRRTTLLSLVSSDPDAVSFLSSHLDDIVKSISQAVLTSSNRLRLREIVYEVFTGQRGSMSLADVFPSLPALLWEPANLGPDPYAVMFAAMSVNGIDFRLVATRIYAPAHFRFDSQVSVAPDVAEPYGSKLRIMWSNPQVWRDAAQAYLSASDDDWDAELVLPDEELDEAMAKHACWFDRAMAVVGNAGYYTDDEESRLAPYVCSHGPYAVFGFPHEPQSAVAAATFNVDCRVGGAYTIQPLLIGEWPICLEWYRVGGSLNGHEFEGYIRQVIEAVPYLDTERGDEGRLVPGLVFLRPATGFDMAHAASIEIEVDSDEEAFTLKSDAPVLAEKVLDEIASRRIRIDRRPPRQYFCVLDVTEHPEVTGLMLTADIEMSFGFRGMNLISSTIVMQKDNVRTLFVALNGRALSLVRLLGKRALVSALSDGLIMRHASGFFKELDVEPPWVEKLLDVDPSVTALFDEPLDLGTPFDLLGSARVTKYKRDQNGGRAHGDESAA